MTVPTASVAPKTIPSAPGPLSEGRLRVLHVDSERPWRGGEQQVLLLMRRQRDRGDEPHLAAPGEGALFRRAMDESFPAHRVEMRGTWDVASALALAKLHRTVEPDIVHWHAARAHALGAIAALLAPGPALLLSRRVDFPVRRSLGSRLLYSLRIDGIVAISEAVRGALIQSGVAPRKIRVVPSGIDLGPLAGTSGSETRSAVRARLGIGDREVLGLNVAALAPHKAQSDLLRAAALARPRAPRLRIWIAGEGPLEEKLLAERRTLGLEQTVRFLGFREDVPDLLRAADFFCISSRLEGMGTSILEGMAAGLPVVATRAGGIPEIVEDGWTGDLVPPGEPGAFAEALVAVAADPERRALMGARARERALDFSADRTAEMTRRLYADVLTGRAGASRGRRRARVG